MKKIIISERILQGFDKKDTIFARGNIELVPARSCEDILDLHRTQRTDIIITEIDQPVMGGVRLCSALRSDETLQKVSIILVCDSDEESLTKGQTARANAVISRPVASFDLFAKIAELLVVPQRKDIRSYLRVSVSGKEKGAPLLGVTTNISISGLLLESNAKFSKGDRLTCALSIGGREVIVECQIVRVGKATAGRFLYGVTFLNIDTKAIVLIDQFVRGGIRH